MAKSKSFFGLRKGSTKTMTYSVLKGQQITKDRVTDIANPRTMDQTLQRIPFAQAVKFYKQATRGLFRFAFEDKKPLESDYNAFMRHNVKYASSVSLDNYRNANYASLGNWKMSQGSLGILQQSLLGENLSLVISEASSDVTTVGGASSLILSYYPNVVEGDIITFVIFQTLLDSTGVYANDNPPTMKVIQFVVDITSSTTLASLGLAAISSGDNALVYDEISEIYAAAGCIILSRNTMSGLKVSENFLMGNSIWNALLTNNSGTQTREGDAYSWGATEKAILQGAVAGESQIV